LNGIAGRTAMTIERTVIVEEDELDILREFMRSKAGRTLDIRSIEGALIYGILYQVTQEDTEIGACCRNGCEKCEQ